MVSARPRVRLWVFGCVVAGFKPSLMRLVQDGGIVLGVELGATVADRFASNVDDLV